MALFAWQHGIFRSAANWPSLALSDSKKAAGMTGGPFS
jgi:hypothetical protein